MEWLTDLAILAGAFGALFAVQWVRNVLAYVYPTVSARALPVDQQTPLGMVDLLENLSPELQSLGFEAPFWVKLTYDNEEPISGPQVAVFLSKNERTLVCVSSPEDLSQPNQPLIWISSCLQDGRYATSQVFDPGHALFSTPAFPGQTLCSKLIQDNLQRHYVWLTQLGSQPDSVQLNIDEALWLLSEASNQQREDLLRTGKLWKDKHGQARFTLLFALRVVWCFLRRPKQKTVPEPIPVARLELLAELKERMQRREPLPFAQLILFAISVGLFILFGGWLWGMTTALMLLVVILIHELGHYFAMRAFGYHQVHMVMLPLVGGVTIGRERQYNAHHRAWMAMMGPLPGILLGWALLVLFLAIPEFIDRSPWLLSFIGILLLVNYINLLPIPPLDGGLVLQAVLPSHAYTLRVRVIVTSCLLGMVAAIWIGFPILAMIAALPLLGIRSTKDIGRAHQFIMQANDTPTHLSTRQALNALEATQGPTTVAQHRLNQAEALQVSFCLEAMTHTQRAMLSLVYCSLFAVPLALAIFFI